MIKVKTFSTDLRILQTMKELKDLDDQVNTFISENNIAKVISVSDTSTVGDGSTIGIIRVLTYEAV